MYWYNVGAGHVINYAFTFHVLKFLNSTILGHKRLVKQKSWQHKTLLYDRINKTYTGIFSVSMPISLTASAITIKIELRETRNVSSKRPSFCPFMQNICCMPFVFLCDKLYNMSISFCCKYVYATCKDTDNMTNSICLYIYDVFLMPLQTMHWLKYRRW